MQVRRCHRRSGEKAMVWLLKLCRTRDLSLRLVELQTVESCSASDEICIKPHEQ